MLGMAAFHIEISCVGTVDMVHDLRKISRRAFKQQVVMVVHQTECMDNRIIFFESLFKIFKKFFPVTLAFEYVFPVITACRHMVRGAGIVYSQGTSHYLFFLFAAKVVTNRIAFYHVRSQRKNPKLSIFFQDGWLNLKRPFWAHFITTIDSTLNFHAVTVHGVEPIKEFLTPAR